MQGCGLWNYTLGSCCTTLFGCTIRLLFRVLTPGVAKVRYPFKVSPEWPFTYFWSSLWVEWVELAAGGAERETWGF